MPWTTPPGSGATVFVWNGYSLAERDRRWSAVRTGAAKAGFDCILVPLGDGIDAPFARRIGGVERRGIHAAGLIDLSPPRPGADRTDQS